MICRLTLIIDQFSGLHTLKNVPSKDKKGKDFSNNLDKLKDKVQDEDKKNLNKDLITDKDLDKAKDRIKDKDKEKSKKMGTGKSVNKTRKFPKSLKSDLNKARRRTPTSVDKLGTSKKAKSAPISSGTSLKPHSPKYGSNFSKDSKSIHSNLVKSLLTGRSHLSQHDDDNKMVGCNNLFFFYNNNLI